MAHHRDNQSDLHGQLGLSDWLNSSLRRAIDESAERLHGGFLSILASVGSTTAPFVGLFGTVWGFITALVGIGVSGQASIDKGCRAGGQALIMTAFGLAVAIPAVLAATRWCAATGRCSGRLNRFAHDLHAYFITGAPLARAEARPCWLQSTSPLRRVEGRQLRWQWEGFRRQRRRNERNQHDAAGRRDAGAADHFHHHRAGADAYRQAGSAARRQSAEPA